MVKETPVAERHFLVVSHTGREETLNAAVTVCRRLIADGVVPVIPEADQADLLAHDAGLSVRILGADVSHTQLELVIVLVGDGTILRAAELARESNAPLLGINLLPAIPMLLLLGMGMVAFLATMGFAAVSAVWLAVEKWMKPSARSTGAPSNWPALVASAHWLLVAIL